MVDVLLNTRGNEVIANEHLRGALLDTLKEENDDVIDCDLKVLVKYMECSKDILSLIGEIVEVGVSKHINIRCWRKMIRTWKNEVA